jgi:hypothetical protein
VGEQVDCLEVEGINECLCIACGLSDGVRRGAGGRSDPGIVEEDNLAAAGEPIGERRVVVVEVAHEVLEKDQRDTAPGTEAAVRETDTVRFDELRRCGVVTMLGHWFSFDGRAQAGI